MNPKAFVPFVANGGIIAAVSASEAESWLKITLLILTCVLTLKKILTKSKDKEE